MLRSGAGGAEKVLAEVKHDMQVICNCRTGAEQVQISYRAGAEQMQSRCRGAEVQRCRAGAEVQV